MAKKKLLPTISELRRIENYLEAIEKAENQLSDICHDYEEKWPDLDTDEYDTLYNAKVLLERKATELRTQGAAIAHKLKHVTNAR